MNNKFVTLFVIITGIILGLVLRDGYLALQFKLQCIFFLSCFAMLLFIFEEYLEKYRHKEEVEKHA